jgi:ABC-type amino acid transport substrate-binding protein
MSSRRWTRPVLALPLLLLVNLAAAPAVAGSLEEIKKEGVLHAAVYRDYAPFSDDGKGIDVDVAKALAARIGVQAEVKEYPDADSIDGDLRNIIWRGHPLWRQRLADVMLHVPVDPHVQQKNEQVTIFAPYFRERLVVARNKTRIPNLPTLQIFTSEKIGVEVETLEDRYLVSSFGGLLRDNVVHYKTLLEATEALKKGDVAAVMGRQTLIEAGLGADASRFEISTAPAPGLATTGWQVGLAVKADNPELVAALTKAMTDLLNDGTIEKIFKQRGLSFRPPVGFEPPKGM